MARKKRKMNPAVKLRLMQLIGVLVTFTPLLVTIAINHEQYFATKAAGWSLTCGGIVAVVLVACSMLGKGKKIFGRGVVVAGIVFVMAYLLKPILLNLQLLSGMLFFGELINEVFFAPKERRLERQVLARESARIYKEEFNG